jgi:hypothetical protein
MLRGSSTKRSTQPGVGQVDAAAQALANQEALLFHEFNQAWDHYRHNETTRSQYLGYFFALSLGVAGFGTQTVKSSSLSSPLELILLEVFLLVFAFLAGFVYLGIRKAGIVLGHYESVWNNIREHFYVGVDTRTDPYRSLNIRSYDHRALRSRWTGIQVSSEFIVLFFSALTIISEFLITARLFVIHNANWMERSIAISISVLVAAIPIILLSGMGSSLFKQRGKSKAESKPLTNP